MVTKTQADTLDALQAHVRTFNRQGRTNREFWERFDQIAGTLGQQAMAPDAPPALRDRYVDLLADADDAGYAVPDAVDPPPA